MVFLFPKLFVSIVLRLSSVYIINSERGITVYRVSVRKPENGILVVPHRHREIQYGRQRRPMSSVRQRVREASYIYIYTHMHASGFLHPKEKARIRLRYLWTRSDPRFFVRREDAERSEGMVDRGEPLSDRAAWLDMDVDISRRGKTVFYTHTHTCTHKKIKTRGR